VSNQRFYIPFELRTQADGSAAFFFDPGDYPALSDPAMIPMPWQSGDAIPSTVSDQQVEDALMTTSAFPGGFGRKRLQYCRRTGLTIDTAKAKIPSRETVQANPQACARKGTKWPRPNSPTAACSTTCPSAWPARWPNPAHCTRK
jgi:hypothetical protein